MTVLGTALGSAVGPNLLANMVQKLKDKNDGEVAEALSLASLADPELKVAIDALLEKLAALPAAEQALPDSDKAWFEQTIQKELADLGSRVSYQAELRGDGAIAQGNGAVAVGAGGMYVSGDYHAAPDPKKEKETHNLDARQNYLTSLYRRCQSLPLVVLGDGRPKCPRRCHSG